MPKLTTKQIMRWNQKCANGFKLDNEKYSIWGEKCISKTISINERQKLVVTLQYNEAFDDETRESYGFAPIINLRLMEKKGDEFIPHGLGYSSIVGDVQIRRNFGVLQILSRYYTDHTVLDLYEQKKDSL